MDYSADLRDPRQGFLLWRHLYGSPPRDGNSGSPDIAEIALAERVCGAPDRDVAARLSGSRPDLWRSAFAACSCHLRDLLQRGANASRIVQGYAPTPTCPAIRLYCRHANLVWLAPSLCEDMIFGRDNPPQAGSRTYHALARLCCRAVRQIWPSNDRCGSQPVKLRTSTTFPLCPKPDIARASEPPLKIFYRERFFGDGAPPLGIADGKDPHSETREPARNSCAGPDA